MTRTMVATEARKARRMAAAAAEAAAAGKTLDAKSLASAPVKPIPASAPPSHRREPSAQQTRAGVGGPSPTAGTSKTPILKGIGTKAGGKYTPPAILRAVANAARNKETKAGAGPGATAAAEDSSANPSKADWTCVKCGKSNFAKRLACFKCASPKPGRTFTAAGMKGYEKRLARREAKRAAETAASGGEASIDKSSADQSKKSKPAETRPKKTSFDDDAGDDAGDVNTRERPNERVQAVQRVEAGQERSELAHSQRVRSGPSRRGRVRYVHNVRRGSEGWAVGTDEGRRG